MEQDDDWERRGYDTKDWAFNGLLLYSAVLTVVVIWQWIR